MRACPLCCLIEIKEKGRNRTLRVSWSPKYPYLPVVVLSRQMTLRESKTSHLTFGRRMVSTGRAQVTNIPRRPPARTKANTAAVVRATSRAPRTRSVLSPVGRCDVTRQGEGSSVGQISRGLLGAFSKRQCTTRLPRSALLQHRELCVECWKGVEVTRLYSHILFWFAGQAPFEFEQRQAQRQALVLVPQTLAQRQASRQRSRLWYVPTSTYVLAIRGERGVVESYNKIACCKRC